MTGTLGRGWDAAVEALARALHVVHGTRGLTPVVPLLLFLALVDPVLPERFPHALAATPLFAVLMAALLTLPREGVAAQARAKGLADDPAARAKLGLALAWPLLLLALLAPRAFLAALGIPHLSPFAGLLSPTTLTRIATVYLFGVMLLPIAYLRHTRRYRPGVEVVRPKDTVAAGYPAGSRDVLLVFTYALGFAWAWLLSPFWHPFSLLEWPPTLDTLSAGVRGVARLAFTLALPLVLLMVLGAHLALLRELHARGWLRKRLDLTLLTLAHASATLGVAALHAYDVLWFVRYQTESIL